MPYIEIISVPKGGGSYWVRSEWVGVKLPLPKEPLVCGEGEYAIPWPDVIRALEGAKRERLLRFFSDVNPWLHMTFAKEYCKFYKEDLP